MELDFRGEVVDFYHRYRRGYPARVVDTLVTAFALDDDDVVIDLGCGTGQLTLPMAPRVRAVLGVDPSPDMLLRAREAAAERRVTNGSWLLGGDDDLLAVGRLLGRAPAAVTVGQALHWMDHRRLFDAAAGLVRPGGGVAVVSNGVPLWQQPSDWSRALRDFLSDWLGEPLTDSCGTAEADRTRYRQALAEAGFRVEQHAVDYAAELTHEQIIGGVYSAFPADQLPPTRLRPTFGERLLRALPRRDSFTEHVAVHLLLGLR